MLRCGALLTGFLLIASTTAFAREIFVDNVAGRDADDGQVPIATQAGSGPVRTLTRAARLARPRDTIILNNTGTPYYDSLSLTGQRHSGDPNAPFVVIGNGATISGLRSVPPDGWRKVRDNLWKLTLTRKGYYQLLRNGKPLTEFVPDPGSDPLASLPRANWVSWQGSLYFRQDGISTPDTQAFSVTCDQTGISLHHVSNVLIVDVNLEHFRFDGLHAQGTCNNVELQNVTSVENGRAGIVSSGASHIDIFGGTVERNGRHQFLTFDRSSATRHEIEPKGPPPEIGSELPPHE